MKKTDFTKALTSYFSTYLPETCGVSPNTCNSYRDAFKLLLLYFQEEKGVPANRIELRMLNRNLASDFLDWLEVQRKVSVTTRNHILGNINSNTNHFDTSGIFISMLFRTTDFFALVTSF